MTKDNHVIGHVDPAKVVGKPLCYGSSLGNRQGKPCADCIWRHRVDGQGCYSAWVYMRQEWNNTALLQAHARNLERDIKQAHNALARAVLDIVAASEAREKSVREVCAEDGEAIIARERRAVDRQRGLYCKAIKVVDELCRVLAGKYNSKPNRAILNKAIADLYSQQVDLPAKYAKIIAEHFWELV